MMKENWLECYLRYLHDHEAVELYHKWCGISCVASVIARRCWTKLGLSNIYPNLFVVLVGPPATSRKGEAIKAAQSILSPLENDPEQFYVKTCSEEITKQGLYVEFENSLQSIRINKKPYDFCALTAISTEMGSFVNDTEIPLIKSLLELFDCKDRHRYGTRNKEDLILYNACFNILAATTPEFFTNLNVVTHIKNGLMSRFIFLFADERRFNKPKGVFSAKTHDYLVKQLRKVTNFVGEVKLSPDADAEFESWYGKFPLTSGNVDHLGTFIGRKQTYVRKLALIRTVMDALNGDKLITQPRHIQKAIEDIEEVEDSICKVFYGLSRTDEEESIQRVIETLQEHEQKYPGTYLHKSTVYQQHLSIGIKNLKGILDVMCLDLKIAERKNDERGTWFRWVGKREVSWE